MHASVVEKAVGLRRYVPSAAPVLEPLVRSLDELGALVGCLSVAQFTRRCGDQFANGTIGAHVRHCLDHARAVLDGHESVIDYDHRARGTPIESDPIAALEEARRLASALRSMVAHASDGAVRVRVMPTRDGDTVEVGSTLGRELSYVLSHTIHHNAMVRGMAVLLGLPVPAEFGYAPATLHHMESTACAR